MFNRRTLAAFTAVAAIAGGASGGVTSSFTAPESAGAADVPVSSSPKMLRGSDPVKAALYQLSQDVKRVNTRVVAIDARTAATDVRTAQTKEMIDALTGMTARSASGRSLVNLVDDILGKTRLICADVVGEVVPIAPDRHVAACD
jgi:predicted transcriptional regulator